MEYHSSKVKMKASSLLFFLLFAIAPCFLDAGHAFLLSCIEAPNSSYSPRPVKASIDINLLNFALNVEYLETEFFLRSTLGAGLEYFAPNYTGGGPPPIGYQIANLDPLTKDIFIQFGLQEVGHVRAIRDTLKEKSIPRPLIDLSIKAFDEFFNRALGVAGFNPYANSVNYLLASYIIPFMGLNGYVSSLPMLIQAISRRLVGGLEGVEASQDAIIRDLLYEKKDLIVEPYNVTIAELTDRLSYVRVFLDGSLPYVDDEGLVVPTCLGAENKTSGNIIAGDYYSLTYSRTPEQILRVLYASGNASIPGGFYPLGANGKIARSYLKKT